MLEVAQLLYSSAVMNVGFLVRQERVGQSAV